MSLNKDQISAVLRTIDNPAADGDLVASGAVQWIAWCDTYGSVKLSLPTGVAPSTMDQHSSHESNTPIWRPIRTP